MANPFSALFVLTIIATAGAVTFSPSSAPPAHNPVAHRIVPFPLGNSRNMTTTATSSNSTQSSTTIGNGSTSSVSTTISSSSVTVPAVVELNSSDGSTVCPAYLSGPGVASVVWDASSSTCTVLAEPNVGPTVCIANSTGGCSGAAVEKLVIDSGVTVSLTSSNGPFGVVLCVYSTLENYGTIEGGSICDYGTIINYGTIDLPVASYFEALPYNGFGVVDNAKEGLIVNNYNFIDAGTVVNNGTIHNKGEFGNDNQYNSVFVNNGVFVGSAPCFSYDGCVTWFGLYNVTSSGTTIDQSAGTGVSLTITGASGTNVAVFSQNQTTAAPQGLGSLNVSSAIFFDVMINGISTGTASVCITNGRVTSAMAGGMQYWNGTGWGFAANQNESSVTVVHPPGPNQTATITQTSNRLCGDVPVAALNGTPLGLGSTSSSRQTVSTTSSSSVPPLSSSSIATHATSTPTPTTQGVSSVSTTQSVSSASTTRGESSPTGSWAVLLADQLYIGTGVVVLIVVLALAIVLKRRGHSPT